MKNKSNAITSIKVSKPDRLVLADRRLFNYLLHNAFSDHKKNTKYEISFETLKGVFSSGSPNTKLLLPSAERLLQITLTIEYEGQSPRYAILNLLSDLQIHIDKKCLAYSFPEACQKIYSNPELLERCLIQTHFEYKYTEGIYSLLVKHAFSNDTQKTVQIDLTHIRQCLSIDVDKLKNFNDFLRFALKPAIDELNWYASFATSFETVTKGRKVVALVFHISNKRKISSLANPQKVIPLKRPVLFIEDPLEEEAYTYLLNTSTKQRRKYFNIAAENHLKKRKKLSIESFDTPDTWFDSCKKEIIEQHCKKKNNRTSI